MIASVRYRSPCEVPRIDAIGRKQLERETANWERLAAAISAIVRIKEV